MTSGSSVLGRIAYFLEDAPSVAPSSEVPALATATWAAAEATSILDRHVAGHDAVPGFARFLTYWLSVPQSVASLSGSSGWSAKISAPDASLANLLTDPEDDPRRMGILTDQGILAARPGISSRALWLMERILGSDFPKPPMVGHPTNLPEARPGVTRRETLDVATESPSCLPCHQLLTPLGASLEHFDASGAYRDLDNGSAVDSSGVLGDVGLDDIGRFEFKSFDDIAPRLAQSCGVARQFTAAMFNDALGFAPSSGGSPAYSNDELDYVANRFVKSNLSVRELVRAIVASPTFLR